MLYQLLLFRAKNGHCRVPGSKGALGSWVVQQRQQYHALKAKQGQEDSKPAAEPSDADKPEEESKRKSQALTEERIAVLNTVSEPLCTSTTRMTGKSGSTVFLAIQTRASVTDSSVLFSLVYVYRLTSCGTLSSLTMMSGGTSSTKNSRSLFASMAMLLFLSQLLLASG